MTAQPLSPSLAKVRKLLPLEIAESDTWITLRDNNGEVFCYVPNNQRNNAQARAEMIRDAMNGME